MQRHGLAIVVYLAVSSTAGCWTSAAAGEEMQRQGQERDQRLERLEAAVRQTGEQLDAKVAQLEEILERATALLARNTADSGAKVEEMQQLLASLQGEVAELRNNSETIARDLALRGSDLEQRLDTIARRGTENEVVPIPADKAGHLSAARAAFTAASYNRARILYREYVTRYASDGEAAQAQFLVGETYRLENQHARALGEYRKVIATYGSSDSVNEALFSMAVSFYELRACSDAKAALEALTRRHPAAPMAKRVKDKLDQIRRAPAEHCTS